jgi:hypothetical protein
MYQFGVQHIHSYPEDETPETSEEMLKHRFLDTANYIIDKLK